ncbi:hypothetical protein F4802DRAFT_368299 [Xylaria palmicola]|nr:hypothetical protein F4802DRAFT_368299 [Xylaria palmicola]
MYLIPGSKFVPQPHYYLAYLSFLITKSRVRSIIACQMPDLTPPEYDPILNLPAYIPPPGVTPKFSNPPNQNALAIAVVTICTSIASILFLTRVYSRIFCSLRPKLEDYLCLTSFLAYIACVYSISLMIRDVGFFIHQWDLHTRDVVVFIYNVYTFLTAYAVMMFFAKTAILLEWIRIFVADRQRNAFFYAACVLIGLNMGMYAAGAIATGLACIPREKLWHPWIEGKCIDRFVLDSFTAFVNLAIDLGILLLPQKVIWKLQMSRKRKIGLSILFSVGIIACASAAGRAYYTVTLDFGGDVTYEASPAFLFGHAEMTTVLMVFCIPSVPKAFEGSRLIAFWTASLRSWTGISSASKDTGRSVRAPASSEASCLSTNEKVDVHSYPRSDCNTESPVTGSLGRLGDQLTLVESQTYGANDDAFASHSLDSAAGERYDENTSQDLRMEAGYYNPKPGYSHRAQGCQWR